MASDCRRHDERLHVGASARLATFQPVWRDVIGRNERKKLRVNESRDCLSQKSSIGPQRSAGVEFAVVPVWEVRDEKQKIIVGEARIALCQFKTCKSERLGRPRGIFKKVFAES